MTTPPLYQAMARYNQWMNEKVYAAAGSLSDTARKEDRGAFFGSIHTTLDHIVFGDRAWMNRLAGREYRFAIPGELTFEDFDELRTARESLDADIVDWTDALTTEWLAHIEHWSSAMYERDFVHPRWGLVQHMFNHQTHHRGQVTTLLSQCGLDVGPTDMPVAPIWAGVT